jgi:hypothetical protein
MLPYGQIERVRMINYLSFDEGVHFRSGQRAPKVYL